MELDVPSLLAHFDSLGKSLSSGNQQNAAVRKELRNAARDLSLALEEPGDIVERVFFQFMEIVSIRIAINLDLFNILVESHHTQTLDELAAATGADPVLLARILRSLGSIGTVPEVGKICKGAYVLTKVSKTFFVPALAAGVEISFDVLSPNWNNLPAYLAMKNYQNQIDILDAAFDRAYHTNDLFITWLATKLDFQRSFLVYMSGFDEGRSSWMDFFPVEEEFGNGARQDQYAIMFIDVGGGMGHEAVAVKKRFPDLPDRFVVQDLPQIVEGQKLDACVDSMAHDFFTPQPLEGARVYYLRYIFHDWNDTLCHQIFSHIRDAMDPTYSQVLINQRVVPTQ